MIKAPLIILIVFLLIHGPSEAQTVVHSEGMNLQARPIIEGLGIPWGMAFVDSQNLFVTERKGSAFLINLKTKVKTPVQGLPKVFHQGQGGLLDVVLHPLFEKNHWVYLTYAKKVSDGSTTALARGVLRQNKLSDVKDLFVAQTHSSRDIHYGSRLAFDQQGYLFMTVGDRGHRHKAQDLSAHNGKVLRLDENGRALPDNPFTKKAKALPEIWSYGHRNPQGLAVHPKTGQIFESEHGPQGGDEINLIKKGANYGWPVVTFGREYWGPKIGEGTHKKGIEPPLKYYVPSIAPSGLTVSWGPQYPVWKGDLFLGALKLTHVNRVKLNKNLVMQKEERLLANLKQRVRHIQRSPDGFLYFSTDNGTIYRLEPVPKKRSTR